MSTTDPSQSPDPARDVFLKPADGRLVRREDGSPWPIHGEWVVRTQFVRRRLADGDLVSADPIAAAAALKADAGAPAAPAGPAPDTATDAARKGRRANATDE